MTALVGADGRVIARRKACAACKKDLPSSRFYRNTRMQSGLSSYCKKCTKERSLARYHGQKVAA